MLKPQVNNASTGTSVTLVTVAANSERILGNIFRHYLYFIQKHPLCLYLGKNQGNPHLHMMEGRSQLGGTEMKPAALRRTIRIKNSIQSSYSWFPLAPRENICPTSSRRPSVITRRLAHLVPGEKLSGRSAGPDFKRLQPRRCPPGDGRRLRGAALNESPQWEMFPALIRRSQMTRFSPGRLWPCRRRCRRCRSRHFMPV